MSICRKHKLLCVLWRFTLWKLTTRQSRSFPRHRATGVAGAGLLGDLLLRAFSQAVSVVLRLHPPRGGTRCTAVIRGAPEWPLTL